MNEIHWKSNSFRSESRILSLFFIQIHLIVFRMSIFYLNLSIQNGLDCQYLDIFFIRNDLDYISFFDLVPTVKSCSTKRNHHHHQCLSAFQIVSQDILGAYSHKIKPSVHFRIWFKFCKRISFPMRIFRLNSIKRFLQNSSTNRYMLVRSSFITLGISLNVWNYFASLFQLNHGEQVFLGSTKLIVLEKNSIRFFCSECNYFFRFLVFS